MKTSAAGTVGDWAGCPTSPISMSSSLGWPVTPNLAMSLLRPGEISDDVRSCEVDEDKDEDECNNHE
eukprot:4084680-Karenia_brevis.AAC.1